MDLRGMARRRAMARRAGARGARRDGRDTVRAGPRGRRRPARGVGALASQTAFASRRQLLGDDGPGPRRDRRPRADGLRRGASRDGAVRRPAPRALRGWRARHRAGVDPCTRAVRHPARPAIGSRRGTALPLRFEPGKRVPGAPASGPAWSGWPRADGWPRLGLCAHAGGGWRGLARGGTRGQ